MYVCDSELSLRIITRDIDLIASATVYCPNGEVIQTKDFTRPNN